MAVRPCACAADMPLLGVPARSAKSEVGRRGVEIDGGADTGVGGASGEVEASTSIGAESFAFLSTEGEGVLFALA